MGVVRCLLPKSYLNLIDSLQAEQLRKIRASQSGADSIGVVH